jgi:hypothetical protein
MSEDSWSWERSGVLREINLLEKEIRSLKTKLDSSIIDIRAVNYWGWYQREWDGFSVPKPEKVWTVLRHEFQYKRQGDPNWVSIPVIDRDDEVINVTLPNGELDE